MKIPATRRQSGFTLIELLVVISIIAVLAAAGFAAGNAAIQKARRTTALSTATAIESAVNNFFTEYGTMPKADMTADTPVDSEDKSFLNELLGLASTSGTGTLNTRAIKFLSVKEGKGNKNGLIYNTAGTTVSGLYDPWGGKFYAMLDGDYDEKIKPEPSAGGTVVTLNGRRVAVWSNGADGVKLGGKAADDVRTW